MSMLIEYTLKIQTLDPRKTEKGVTGNVNIHNIFQVKEVSTPQISSLNSPPLYKDSLIHYMKCLTGRASF